MSQPQGPVMPNVCANSPQDDAVYEQQADVLSDAAFADVSSAPKAIEVICRFIRSYDQHRHEMPLAQWLVHEFNQQPDLWANKAEAERVAQVLIDSVIRTNQHKASLQQHLDMGKSATNWLARELEQDAQRNPDLKLPDYAAQVQGMLQSANAALLPGMQPDIRQTTLPSEVLRPSIWDDNARLAVSKEINNQALLNAALNASCHGARILGQRAWNWMRGEENAPASEALQAFFDSSLKSAQHVGAQVAVSGGVLVAAKRGWLGLPAETPVEVIAATTYTGLEQAKALYKLGQGDILADSAINAIEQTTLVAARSLAQMAEEKGAELGTQWGMSLGAAFGPQGVAVGGMLGGIAGRLGGKAVGALIEKGGRKIVEVASKVVRKVSEGIREAVSAFADGVKNFVGGLFN
ncbi:hypothetical protein AB7M23_003235 [Pseudomonas sp. HLS-6 TE3448]